MSKRKSSNGKKWTKAQDSKIVRMKLAGNTDRQIATVLNRTPASVSVRCTTLRNTGLLPKAKRKGQSKNNVVKRPISPAETAESIKDALTTELNGVLARLLTYVSMLERQNAQLTKTLNEVRSAVEN
jgi:predicted transcriptional regulator